MSSNKIFLIDIYYVLQIVELILQAKLIETILVIARYRLSRN